MCPGYTTTLPEVVEVARARLHWNKGSLLAFTREEPAESLVMGLEILEGAVNETSAWVMDNPMKKAT